jgi:hypothetical protein
MPDAELAVILDKTGGNALNTGVNQSMSTTAPIAAATPSATAASGFITASTRALGSWEKCLAMLETSDREDGVERDQVSLIDAMHILPRPVFFQQRFATVGRNLCHHGPGEST